MTPGFRLGRRNSRTAAHNLRVTLANPVQHRRDLRHAGSHQRLLDDSAMSVEQWLVQSIEKEFNRQEGIAFLAGDGVNKAAGLLTYATGGANAASHPGGAIKVTTAAITVNSLIDFMCGLATPIGRMPLGLCRA